MSRPKQTRDWVIDQLLFNKLWKNRSITRMHVVAVRGYFLNSKGKPGQNDRGIYDDAFFVITPDTFAAFNGNTDPSRYRRGMAMLKAPQKIVYRKGYHGYGRRSGHPAFRQASNVIVHRDGGVGNGKSLGNGLFTDAGTNRFWTNLHRGGSNTTSSLGCLTVPAMQWNLFYDYVSHQMKLFHQTTFNCYLVENK